MAFASCGSGCPCPVVACSFATPALFTRSCIPLGSASPTFLASASTSSRFVISAEILAPLQLSRHPRRPTDVPDDAPIRPVPLDDVVQRVLPAPRDVHLRAVRDEGLGYHQPDARSTAGHDGLEAVQREELGGLEGVVGLVRGVCCCRHLCFRAFKLMCCLPA